VLARISLFINVDEIDERGVGIIIHGSYMYVTRRKTCVSLEEVIRYTS
jgi:hypothetical protein